MRLHLATIGKEVKSARAYNEVKGLRYALSSFIDKEKACDDTLQLVGVDNFLVDSGAFSFMSGKTCDKTSLRDYQRKYINYIKSRKINLFFELDVDTIFGLDFVHELRKDLESETGKKCIPVWHKSRGVEYWKWMVDNYDYIAIGGLVFHVKKQEYALIRKMVAYARAKGVKVHGLGYTKKDVLSYAFYSIDSTSYLASAVRGGNLQFFDGKYMKTYHLVSSKKKDLNAIKRNNIKEWIKFQHYLDSKPW